MSIHQTTERFTAWRSRTQLCWVTISMFAILIAFADGFVVTSLQGAVGAIERRQPPLGRWLRDSTLMTPLYFLAVVGAVLLARRLVGHRRGTLVKVGATALLVTVITCGVGIAETTASAVYDYHLQTQHIALAHQLSHVHTAVAQPGAVDPVAALKQATFNVHVRAVLDASMVLLITNLALVAFVLALRSERLWRRAASRSQVAEPTRHPSAGPALI